MAKKTIGIPRAMFYYVYFPAWKTFFERLGFRVVTSPKTTKEILDAGVREALAEACVPVKIYFGHVLALKDRVDYLFVPRIISINGETIYCPKFLGMADMVKSALPNMPTVLDVTVNKKRSRFSLFWASMELGRRLGKGSWATFRAIWAGWKVHRKYDRILKAGYTPDEAMDYVLHGKPLPVKQDEEGGETLRLALLGYPYTTHDSFISVEAIQKLKSLGVKVITAEMVSPRLLKRQAGKLVKGIFWTFSDITSKAAFHFFENAGEVDGIMHLTAFGCGPDFMVDKLMEIEAKKRGGKVPFMTLMIDEHTGEAGMLTRIEAVCEMVRRRKEAAV